MEKEKILNYIKKYNVDYSKELLKTQLLKGGAEDIEIELCYEELNLNKVENSKAPVSNGSYSKIILRFISLLLVVGILYLIFTPSSVQNNNENNFEEKGTIEDNSDDNENTKKQNNEDNSDDNENTEEEIPNIGFPSFPE